jgi:hypothetical protein
VTTGRRNDFQVLASYQLLDQIGGVTRERSDASAVGGSMRGRDPGAAIINPSE